MLHAADQVHGHRDGFVALGVDAQPASAPADVLIRVEEFVTGAEEVFDGGAEGGIALQAAFHCADETGGDNVAVGTLGQGRGGGEIDDVAGVGDCHDALDLVGDVREGRFAIHDLI